MRTPVLDFVKQYAASEPVRMHMPGHKGKAILGCEATDITEISGAGELYASDGPVGQGEANTAALFGTAKTCWVTEGSSQCIRAMLALALQGSKSRTVIAARNVHRAFLTGCALLDAHVVWLSPETEDFNLCSCPVTARQVEDAILKQGEKPACVWLTSPDYLGAVQDVAAIAAVCRRCGVPLLVDNAHGAYLKFLECSRHPMDLGADLCCDSAHKTLPALTGCAYLHIGKNAPASFARDAKGMLALFGSTSPSWLLLQSLDGVNPLLESEYPRRLREIISAVADMKFRLRQAGWQFFGEEPLKMTVDAKACGYTGPELADCLRQQNIECEYAETDFLVLMPSPWNSPEELRRLEAALGQLPILPALPRPRLRLPAPSRVMSIREAMLAPCETIPVAAAVGRVLASGALTCPPAVSVVTAGEVISPEAVEIMKYYGTEEVSVVSHLG